MHLKLKDTTVHDLHDLLNLHVIAKIFSGQTLKTSFHSTLPEVRNSFSKSFPDKHKIKILKLSIKKYPSN